MSYVCVFSHWHTHSSLFLTLVSNNNIVWFQFTLVPLVWFHFGWLVLVWLVWPGPKSKTGVETMAQLVQGASQRVRTLLAKAEGITEAALDTVSSQLNSEDLADIPSQTKQSNQQLKKYKQKLRKAKADHYTDKCEVYEAACPDPILAPEITEPARSST